ncbi:helix-turn-helix domain-containing protein [Streptomyces sp. NPDC055085]
MWAGPAAYGWEEQRWSLARVGVLVEEWFEVTCAVCGVWRLLEGLGWSWQVSRVRAVERSEEAIAPWCTRTWPAASSARGSRPRVGGSASRTRTRPGPG